MDIVTNIFSLEGKALIKGLAHQVEHGEAIGSFSPSVYDTAWLAMISKADGNPTLLFPECLRYLLETQNQDGGWPEYASEVDGILNTMAATIALKKQERQQRPGPNSSSLPGDIGSRVLQAKQYLRVKLQTWDVACAVRVGFEILVPALLELLEKDDEKFEFPGRRTLMALNQAKLGKFRPEILYSELKTTLIHSLEAFVGKIDFDKVYHHLDEHGSMMGSPSATAAYLMQTSQWNESAETYLRKVVTLGSGKGGGGVPSAFPSAIFETTWIASTLLKAGLSPDALGREELGKIAAFLQSQLISQGGLVGFDSGLLADADDTANAILTTNLLGFPSSPKRMIDEFEAAHHFRTYKGEKDESFSANCTVLGALLRSPNPTEYFGPIAKVTQFLCKRWYSGRFLDKWNLSEQYSMMLLSQALVQLLQGWDSAQLRTLPEDLIRNHIPLVLFQVCIRTLERQTSEGSWGLKAPSREITAYAVLTLKTLSTLPWMVQFRSQILKAIKKGSMFLAISHDDWGSLERIWVEKVTYALPSLSRAYCIAALCAGNSFKWSERVTDLVTVSGEKTKKLTKFFSQLPMFSKDERWLLEADVAAGALFLPQLMRISSDIFPRQEKIVYKYLEYIPFTWIATNRQNGSPLSNDMLWEMMVIALLDYQLDEFMETVFGKDEELKELEAIKSIVRRLCKPPNNDSSNINGSINGNTNGITNANSENTVSTPLEQVEVVLSSFTSYIFKHPKVLQSPEHVRQQLYKELETCMLTHIEHEGDNARFATQQREQQALQEATSKTGTKVLAFHAPRSTYYSWVRTTSADNTHCPFTFLYFLCLAAPEPGEPFFKGVRQHYLSNDLCRHLANLCRQYNDFGSVARDQAESNLNSLNFPEFHEPYTSQGDGSCGERKARDESAMKKDLFFIAEYERQCLNHAIDKLNTETRISKEGVWKSNALKSFIDTVDLYGQIYVARDITNRVK